MEKQLEDLTTKLSDALGDRIVSVILYGSAAAGDWQERSSDINILCLLKAVTVAEIKSIEPVSQWWAKQGNLPPVLMTEEELLNSADCFPVEFHDIQERRRVLLGRDVAADLKVDFTYYRAIVERELRSKQIRLRQKSLELLGQHDRLAKLLTDSVSTFCALGRHALMLGKRPARWKKQEVLAALSDATGSSMRAANQLLVLRESGKNPAAGEILPLLDEYLKDIAVIVHFVDSLDK